MKSRGLATSVGDEGGFAPNLSSDEEAIQLILEAVRKAGYEPGKDFVLAMDAASSEWKGEKKGEYLLPKSGKRFTSGQLVAHWKALCEKYPIYSIEDGLDEEDWEGWQMMTKELGDRVPAGRRRPFCYQYTASWQRYFPGLRQFHPDQAQSDRKRFRDSGSG